MNLGKNLIMHLTFLQEKTKNSRINLNKMLLICSIFGDYS